MAFFSGQKVTFGVAFRVTLGETPKVTFLSLLSYFYFFGVSGLLGGQRRHKTKNRFSKALGCGSGVVRGKRSHRARNPEKFKVTKK